MKSRGEIMLEQLEDLRPRRDGFISEEAFLAAQKYYSENLEPYIAQLQMSKADYDARHADEDS